MGSNELPLTYTLKTNDWETIEQAWGVNMPERFIWVRMAGFRIRKKRAFFGGSGSPTPACVNYGGWEAVGVQTIQIKGKAGSTVFYEQGVGKC